MNYHLSPRHSKNGWAKNGIKGEIMLTSTLVVEKAEFKKEWRELSVKSFWLSLGEMRLDASHYAKDVSRATRLLEESGYEIIDLEELSEDAFTLARIKRFYGDSRATPYLMPSELFYFPLSPKKHVFANKIKNVEKWFLQKDWLLITCSGKIGKLLIVTNSYKGFIVSHDVVRLIPKEDTLTAFLYAYLSSWVGQALLTKDEYGVAVDHIEPHHVKSVKLPLLPTEIEKMIHNNISKVFILREKARTLFAKSQEELLKALELPELRKQDKTEPFSVKSSNLKLRFDASYHDPIVDKIQGIIKKCKYSSKRIGDNIGDVFIPGRFKRIYVEKDYGIPFLSGTQIVQMKPYDLKYISTKVTKNIENWVVRTGWVLVTCSGTIGRVALVPKEWDKWAISQHVLRIIPNTEEINNGFLVAFLQSEYGHLQVVSKIYGCVVDELAEDDLKDVLVPLPPMDLQEKIGKLVIEAYELKEIANKIENDTVKTLEELLMKHQKKEDAREQLADIESYAETFELLGDEDFREGLEQARKGEIVPYDS